MNAPTFSEYLQHELLKRCRANPRYSLRAFAKSLSLEPSALSKVLRGRRRLTRTTFLKVASRIGLSPGERELYMPGIKLTRGLGKQAEDRENENRPPAHIPFRSLPDDYFEIIADWYHYAILCLTELRQFRGDPKWVAKTLGISVNEANLAIARLRRVGLLEITPQGKWIDRSGAVSSYRKDYTNAALRKLQRRILEMALLALEEIPIERRDQSSMTVAIESRRIPQAKERIKKFRRELCEFLQGDERKRDQVYHLSFSLYPVTQLEES